MNVALSPYGIKWASRPLGNNPNDAESNIATLKLSDVQFASFGVLSRHVTTHRTNFSTSMCLGNAFAICNFA
jgi:hypothetical protein